MLIQKICHKGPLHLQKIVSQPSSANREPHTVIRKPEYTEMAFVSSWMSGKETSTKENFIFTRRNIDQTL